MSAAVAVLPVILPAVWAYAETASAWREQDGTAQRKGPHALRLVQACAEGQEAPGAEAGLAFGAELQLVPAPAEVVPLPVLVADEAQAPETLRVALYRQDTERMLRQYQMLSMEAGRVPSLLGRELFQSNVSHSKVESFEAVVIYVLDVEKCLSRLEPGQRCLIRRIALQGYTREETAAMYGIAFRTVVRRYTESLDCLTRMFLRFGLMARKTECSKTQ